MSDYDTEYYFICKPKSSPQLPFLIPDLDTSNRNYDFEAQQIGLKPLVFHNANKEDNLRERIKSTTTDILFDGTNLVVRDKMRMKLLNMEIPHLSICPAIYIDNEDKWHEDFWFLTFTERFDCWDRKTSNYDQEGPPIRLGGYEFHQVYKYSFNDELMRKIALEQRLLFKLGGTLDAYICAHYSILSKVFGDPGKNGAQYIRVKDY